VKLAKPEFPVCAEDRRVPGFVDLVFTIEPDGSVGDLQVVQETPAGFGFAKAALDVFPAWKFQPKLVDGKPAASRVTYRMSWKPA
jgi:protein TonB